MTDTNKIKMRKAFNKAITNNDGNAAPLCEESFNAGWQAAYRPKQVGDELRKAADEALESMGHTLTSGVIYCTLEDAYENLEKALAAKELHICETDKKWFDNGLTQACRICQQPRGEPQPQAKENE